MAPFGRILSILSVAVAITPSLGKDNAVCFEKQFILKSLLFEDSDGNEFVPFFFDPIFLTIPENMDIVNFTFWLIILVSLCLGMMLYIRGALMKYHAVKNIREAHEDLQKMVENINYVSEKRRKQRILMLPKEEQVIYEEMKKKREEFRQKLIDERSRHFALTEFPVGTNVNGYRVEKKLGDGAFGVVYLVTSEDGRKFAMKTEGLYDNFLYGLKSDIAVLSAVKIAGTARHFCELQDAGVFHDRKYIIMSVLGQSIADFLCEKVPFSMGCAFGLACQALQALEQLHEAGFVHRDLKGENYMMGAKSGDNGIAESRKVYLIDFGTTGRYTCPMCVRKSKLQQSGQHWENGLTVVGAKEFEEIMDKLDEQEKASGSREERNAFLAKEIVKLDNDWREIVDKDGNILPERHIADLITKKRVQAADQFKDFFLPDKGTLNVEAVSQELRNRERSELESGRKKSQYADYFDAKGVLNAKMAMELFEQERRQAEYEAEFAVRWRIKNARRLISMKRCRHAELPWMAKVGKYPVAILDPYELHRCPNTACFAASIVSASEKPYGRKDDLESWFYVMIDWLTKLKFRMCNDDVEKGHIARLKISSRYGADAKYLLTYHDEADILNGIEDSLAKKGLTGHLPVNQLNKIIQYIDSLEYFEKPNYAHIYNILDHIMQQHCLSPFPLDWERPSWPGNQAPSSSGGQQDEANNSENKTNKEANPDTEKKTKSVMDVEIEPSDSKKADGTVEPSEKKDEDDQKRKQRILKELSDLLRERSKSVSMNTRTRDAITEGRSG